MGCAARKSLESVISVPVRLSLARSSKRNNRVAIAASMTELAEVAEMTDEELQRLSAGRTSEDAAGCREDVSAMSIEELNEGIERIADLAKYAARPRASLRLAISRRPYPHANG